MLRFRRPALNVQIGNIGRTHLVAKLASRAPVNHTPCGEPRRALAHGMYAHDAHGCTRSVRCACHPNSPICHTPLLPAIRPRAARASPRVRTVVAGDASEHDHRHRDIARNYIHLLRLCGLPPPLADDPSRQPKSEKTVLWRRFFCIGPVTSCEAWALLTRRN